MPESACLPARDYSERLVLVDRNDVAIGVAEKLDAHKSGMLHRAFSVIVLNSCGGLSMQQRATCKYHSGGLWSNACCGHPRPGEDTIAAAERRLHEEMGIHCTLAHWDEFMYRAHLTDSLVEREYDHVLVGVHEGDPVPDPREVMAWRWSAVQSVMESIVLEPERYTVWLPLVLRLLPERVSSCRPW